MYRDRAVYTRKSSINMRVAFLSDVILRGEPSIKSAQEFLARVNEETCLVALAYR